MSRSLGSITASTNDQPVSCQQSSFFAADLCGPVVRTACPTPNREVAGMLNLSLSYLHSLPCTNRILIAQMDDLGRQANNECDEECRHNSDQGWRVRVGDEGVAIWNAT